jgi:hypothetical protein
MGADADRGCMKGTTRNRAQDGLPACLAAWLLAALSADAAA